MHETIKKHLEEEVRDVPSAEKLNFLQMHVLSLTLDHIFQKEKEKKFTYEG